MAVYEVMHSGGLGDKVTVTDVPTLLQAENSHRAWFYMRSDPANLTDPMDPTTAIRIYVHKTVNMANVVADKGIMLLPGEYFEINRQDLYQGNLWAICDAGQTAELFIHTGIA
jgi:hypothetical protein